MYASYVVAVIDMGGFLRKCDPMDMWGVHWRGFNLVDGLRIGLLAVWVSSNHQSIIVWSTIEVSNGFQRAALTYKGLQCLYHLIIAIMPRNTLVREHQAGGQKHLQTLTKKISSRMSTSQMMVTVTLPNQNIQSTAKYG